MFFNKEVRKVLAIGMLLHVGALVACQPAAELEEDSVLLTSDKPSLIMGVVGEAALSVGQGLVGNGAQQAGQSVQGKLQTLNAVVDSRCDENSTPIDSQGQMLDNQDPDYPSRVFYCKLAKNSESPDSVPGSFHMIKSISCAVENAGVVFDGVARQVFVPFDTNCFSQDQLNDMGVSSMQLTVQGSKPASFNTYYDTGISIDVPQMGNFKMAAKVVGTRVEFMTVDDQTAFSADKSGSYAASYDLLTGWLKFESRTDRFLCSEQNSCGWSRHDRILAQVSFSQGEITGVSSIEGLTSEIYHNGAGQYSARTSTIKGNLNQGMKARFYQLNSVTSSDLADASLYAEVVNNRCYTNSSDQADCSANPGIAMPSSGAFSFSLHPTAQPTSPLTWAAQLTGLTFNSLSFADVQ